MKRRNQIMIGVATALMAAVVVVAQPATKEAQAARVPAQAAATVAQAAPVPTVDVSRSTTKKAMPTEITLQREVFDYDKSGRRDPYKSLMTSSDVRPLLSDLRLTAVAFDPDGNNSVAILRDSFSKQQYRIRVGQQLGRLRVSSIKQGSVQFTIEEFGFNRQETLALAGDTTKVRNP